MSHSGKIGESSGVCQYLGTSVCDDPGKRGGSDSGASSSSSRLGAHSAEVHDRPRSHTAIRHFCSLARSAYNYVARGVGDKVRDKLFCSSFVPRLEVLDSAEKATFFGDSTSGCGAQELFCSVPSIEDIEKDIHRIERLHNSLLNNNGSISDDKIREALDAVMSQRESLCDYSTQSASTQSASKSLDKLTIALQCYEDSLREIMSTRMQLVPQLKVLDSVEKAALGGPASGCRVQDCSVPSIEDIEKDTDHIEQLHNSLLNNNGSISDDKIREALDAVMSQRESLCDYSTQSASKSLDKLTTALQCYEDSLREIMSTRMQLVPMQLVPMQLVPMQLVPQLKVLDSVEKAALGGPASGCRVQDCSVPSIEDIEKDTDHIEQLHNSLLNNNGSISDDKIREALDAVMSQRESLCDYSTQSASTQSASKSLDKLTIALQCYEDSLREIMSTRMQLVPQLKVLDSVEKAALGGPASGCRVQDCSVPSIEDIEKDTDHIEQLHNSLLNNNGSISDDKIREALDAVMSQRESLCDYSTQSASTQSASKSLDKLTTALQCYEDSLREIMSTRMQLVPQLKVLDSAEKATFSFSEEFCYKIYGDVHHVRKLHDELLSNGVSVDDNKIISTMTLVDEQMEILYNYAVLIFNNFPQQYDVYSYLDKLCAELKSYKNTLQAIYDVGTAAVPTHQIIL